MCIHLQFCGGLFQSLFDVNDCLSGLYSVHAMHATSGYCTSTKMIGQKPSIAILSLNLVEHPYIALEKQCISDRTFSQSNLKMSDC